MPRRQPPLGFSRSSITRILLATLLIVSTSNDTSQVIAAANAPQKHALDHQHDGRSAPPAAPNIYYDNVRDTEDTSSPLSAEAALNPIDARALATLAPASGGDAKAVRAPFLATRSSNGGLASRLPARSLQDWQVEDFVLLATVDGSIHARDRKTGAPRWSFEADRPMVETIYHHENKSDSASGPTNGFLWIVEPTQDGSLYGFTPGSPLGMQKLGLTVRKLVEELSPYASEDPPVVYTGEKRNTMYTVDAATGKILKVFNAAGSTIIGEESCRRVDSLEYLDDDECGVTGTITLARTEYTVGIQSSDTGKPICTIRYFEWGPNHRDKDLYNQYLSTKDNRYVYSLFDGRVLALDHLGNPESIHGPDHGARPTYRQKFTSPVAQVFDLARPSQPSSRDVPLVILPQPSSPTFSFTGSMPDDNSRVFVNCTESGSWYALSQTSFPLVTDGASPALCSQTDYILGGFREHQSFGPALRKTLVGVHSLAYPEEMPEGSMMIGGSSGMYTIDPPKSENAVGPVPAGQFPALPEQPAASSWLPLYISVLCIAVVSTYIGSKLGSGDLTALRSLFKKTEATVLKEPQVPTVSVDSLPTKPLQEEAANQINQGVAKESKKGVQWADENAGAGQEDEDDAGAITEGEGKAKANGGPSVNADGSTTTPLKKKAHRGRRGGRKLAERKAMADQQGDVQKDPSGDKLAEKSQGVKEDGKSIVVQPDAVNTNGASQDSSGPKGLQNLRISDKVLGSGSGGTFVFAGEFEGRDVAVKRMLPQFFELASQEVTLLEQSEDHPNVIRYFCRREDQHFLYIALELCQASLWDIFRDGKQDQPADNPAHAALVQAINADPRKALKQLAEGVKYLHSFRIVHRDIKPQNMLIAYPKKNNLGSYPRLVISDFGLCKTLPDNASTLIGTTGNAGTAGWKAPELILKPRDAANSSQHSTNGTDSSQNGIVLPPGTGVKRAVDIFSMGCVFFYILTQGHHPFDDEEGWPSLRERNIKTGRANYDELAFLGPDAEDLIRWMLSPDPQTRPTAAEVLAHPFFWDAETRLEFLSTASDRFDQEPRDGSSQVLATLEARAAAIIPLGVNGASYSASHSHLRANGASAAPAQMVLPIPSLDFFAQLDAKFIDTLGRQRKYDPAKLADLLRALRNKHHHWDDMPPDVKKRVGQVPEGYLAYWEKRFPALVVGVWRAVEELGVGEERRFWKWFGTAEK